MEKRKWIVRFGILACLFFAASTLQAAPVPGSAGSLTMLDGPNAEGLYFELEVYYEAFDGLDAGDPLGVTPGKKQYAYIVEYVSGNAKMKFFDVESVNKVPLIEVATSTNGTVNSIAPGTIAPPVKTIITMPSGNPAARFVFPAGLSGVGNRTVMLVFTAADNYDVGLVLAQITDTSLSMAGEVVGPTECFGTISGSVFCLACGPEGQVAPMEGMTINVISDTNDVNTVVTGENGQYSISGLGTGHYIVSVANAENYAPCSTGVINAEITCTTGATANFCVCPVACQQQICVRVVCTQTGVEVPVRAWIGITGPAISKWLNTGCNGTRCFKGEKIVPGHYVIRVQPPKGYEIVGDAAMEFDLAECENKELVFNACPIPPCTQTACVSVVEAGDDGNMVPVPNVEVCVNCKPVDRKCGTTGSDGKACFNLKPGHHSATIKVPVGYRLCDGDNKTEFSLARCESEEIQFVLCKIEFGPCPEKAIYWKTHPNEWPVEEMWIGADYLQKAQLMNLLNGKLADGSPASCQDVTVELAQYLIAVKLSIANGSNVADIEPAVVATDEFLLYDYPPGTKPRGKGFELARKLKNQLFEYLMDRQYCQP